MTAELQNCRIIPTPKRFTEKNRVQVIKPEIMCEARAWEPLVKAFIECAHKIFGVKFTEGSGGIKITLDESIEQEAYVVDVDTEVKVYASEYHGCAYALATVLQLLNDKLQLDSVWIEDKPDKDYRGLMVDLAREWHPFSRLLKYVDVCFFYKVKYLHLHFVDDERYTLPSEKFPKLPTAKNSYSLEEINKLRNYAKARGVVLVPEIEMPGHTKALVTSYPELFGNAFDEEEKERSVTETGARFDRASMVCAGSESVFGHITELIDEVLDMFPEAPYIHLGGDEVNVGAWKECPDCREYMKRHNIQDVQGLYADFIKRVTDYVLSKGRRPIVWEGFSKEYNDMISKDVIVIGWECHYQNPDDLISGGFEVINCSWKPLYIVADRLLGKNGWDETDILKWNVYEWQHWWEKSAATLNPFHLEPTNQVIGAQVCAWEMTYECEIAAVVIRLAALSERTWSVKRYCTDEEFRRKLLRQMKKVFRLMERHENEL